MDAEGTRPKETKFEHKALCWVIDDPKRSYVVVQLGGQGPKGKLSGHAYYYPDPSRNWNKESIIWQSAKQGIYRIDGRCSQVAGLAESVEATVKEWIAANPEAWNRERNDAQARYLANRRAAAKELSEKLAVENARIAAAESGEWWYDIAARERKEYWARVEAKEREVTA